MDLDGLLAAAFDLERTFAVVVQHGGEVVAERYADHLEHLDKPPEPIGADTPLLSWSMAKSVLHALVGMLVMDGALEVDAPADVPRWRKGDDPRRHITLEHLLTMTDGLDFFEDYEDFERSDAIAMLFGDGKDDVAGYAEQRPLAHDPGSFFSYSSGTSNVVSGIVARTVGPGQPYEDFLQHRLFDPLGMTSARATFDGTGTFVGSSFVYATARDFARFGQLYLQDGVWEGERLLPSGWVVHGRRFRHVDEETGSGYGAHWWTLAGDNPHGVFWASGFEGQRVLVAPSLDLVVVRLGKTPSEGRPQLHGWLDDVVDAFARTTA
jgi:CubicO group peptidase (beta-lactamase class C family)